MGQPTYSPGLVHDAKVYQQAFTKSTSLSNCSSINGSLPRFEVVNISPEWDRNGTATEATLAALRNNLDVIIGLEELGSQDMIDTLHEMRSSLSRNPSSPRPIIIWVPNLEVTSDDRTMTKNGKWRATLEALPTNLIDIIVAKMPRVQDFMRCIRNVYQAYEAELNENQIVHIPHTCHADDAARTGVSSSSSMKKKSRMTNVYAAASAAAAAAESPSQSNALAVPPVINFSPQFTDTSLRTTILHFAGSSPHKNTVENCRAGLEIVKLLNLAEGRQRFSLTVFICPWPSKRGEGPPLYAIGLEAYLQLQSLAASHPNEFHLQSGGFMSYQSRRELLSRTRLALCASRAEGFGHYILEAAAAGCLVVTTDGPPMSSLLTEPSTFALASPTKEEVQCYGFGYVVPAKNIVTAAMSLPLLESNGYSAELILKCVENETKTRARFQVAMEEFKWKLKEMVEAGLKPPEAKLTHTISPSPPPPPSISPSSAPSSSSSSFLSSSLFSNAATSLFSSNLPFRPMPITAVTAEAIENKLTLQNGVFHASLPIGVPPTTTPSVAPPLLSNSSFSTPSFSSSSSLPIKPPPGFGATRPITPPTSIESLSPPPPHAAMGTQTQGFDAFTSLFSGTTLKPNPQPNPHAPPSSSPSYYSYFGPPPPSSSIRFNPPSHLFPHPPSHSTSPIQPHPSHSHSIHPSLSHSHSLPTPSSSSYHVISGTASLADLEARMRSQAENSRTNSTNFNPNLSRANNPTNAVMDHHQTQAAANHAPATPAFAWS